MKILSVFTLISLLVAIAAFNLIKDPIPYKCEVLAKVPIVSVGRTQIIVRVIEPNITTTIDVPVTNYMLCKIGDVNEYKFYERKINNTPDNWVDVFVISMMLFFIGFFAVIWKVLNND